jgi:hypothetical protein
MEERKMKTIKQMSPRWGFSVAAALALSVAAAGAANANPIPTSSDEARALAGQNPARQSTRAATVPHYRAAVSTDEARALAAESVPGSGVVAKVSQANAHVTSTDEARAAFAATTDNRTAERRTAPGARARVSVQRP